MSTRVTSAALSCATAMRRASRHANEDCVPKSVSNGMSPEGSSDDDASPARQAQAPRTRRPANAARTAPPKKTEKPLCLDFLKGKCHRFRHGCRYYHPEPGEVVPLEQLAGTQVCEVWALSGFCKFGTKCWKEHPEMLRRGVCATEPITRKFQGWMHTQLALPEAAEKEPAPAPSPEFFRSYVGPGASRDAAPRASPDAATAHRSVCRPAEPAEAKKVCAAAAWPLKKGAADGGEVPPKRCGVVRDCDLCWGLFDAEVLTGVLVAAPSLDGAAR